jgi:hypothetical protein
MNPQQPDHDDEQWLNALAGKQDPNAAPQTNLQAAALRRALQARKDQLEAQVPVADDAQYQQLLFRLRRESLASSKQGWRNHKLWGVAATVVVGIGVVIQMGVLNLNPDDANVMRGSEKSTVLVVADPETRLSELLTGLKVVGEEPSVKREANSRIVLTIKASDKALDYLTGQRIEPMVTNGQVTLTLMPAKAKAE